MASPRIAALVTIVLASSFAAAPASSEEDFVIWQMNSLLHPKLFGESAVLFAEMVGLLSNGSFVIEVHDRMVLDQDTFGALDSGLVDAVWGSAGHHHREDPRSRSLAGFPSGPIRQASRPG